jgi:hypothetical protein
MFDPASSKYRVWGRRWAAREARLIVQAKRTVRVKRMMSETAGVDVSGACVPTSCLTVTLLHSIFYLELALTVPVQYCRFPVRGRQTARRNEHPAWTPLTVLSNGPGAWQTSLPTHARLHSLQSARVQEKAICWARMLKRRLVVNFWDLT